MSEFAFHRLQNLVQASEVSVVQTSPPCQFPDTLDGVQLRAIGGEVVEREVIGVPFPPRAVKSSVVVFRIVGNDHDTPSGSSAGRPQVPEKLPAGYGVKLICFTLKEELAIA
jgi:hypothetical protein